MCALDFYKKSATVPQMAFKEDTMNNLKRKLTSRKFWASIASFVSMLLIYFGHAESEATQISALIMAGASIVGYVIGEGLADSSNSGGDDNAS